MLINDSVQIVTAIPRLIVLSCSLFLFKWDIEDKETFDIYIRGASALAEAVGLMAHSEFEFLSSKVKTARQLLVEARQQLIEHTAKHGC